MGSQQIEFFANSIHQNSERRQVVPNQRLDCLFPCRSEEGRISALRISSERTSDDRLQVIVFEQRKIGWVAAWIWRASPVVLACVATDR